MRNLEAGQAIEHLAQNIAVATQASFAAQPTTAPVAVERTASTEGSLTTIPCPLIQISVFDVPSVEALHDTLMRLPLFPYMDIEVDGLCRHPSSIHNDDR